MVWPFTGFFCFTIFQQPKDTIMKHIHFILGLALMTMLFVNTAQAQIGNGRLYSFDVDTLTNADTLTFNFPWTLSDDYDYTIEVTCTNLSGTTAVTAKLQESVGGSGYAVKDTVAFTATATEFLTGSNTGRYHRYYLTSSGTQSTQVKIWVWYRRK